jgi:hypothetical protein
MKKLLHSILFLMMVGLIVWQLTGCKRTPSPPTEQDAIAVWKNVNSPPPDLVSLTKTNGQMETVNGLRIYTLYYQAKVKTTCNLGTVRPGPLIFKTATIRSSGQRRAGLDLTSRYTPSTRVARQFAI